MQQCFHPSAKYLLCRYIASTEGGVGVNTTLSLIFYKNVFICAKDINCFRIHFACSFVELLKYHGINLHGNFKEHCKWAKKW